VTNSPEIALERMRIDKWLWAARFYKTRSLAAQAIAAGHVRLDGHTRQTCARDYAAVTASKSPSATRLVVAVHGLNEQRRPARGAATLRGEQPRAARGVRRSGKRQLAPVPGSDLRGRPTKKARRQIRGFNEGF
jgi:ribosome-associated heat shock protein Hsp15